MSVAKKVLEKFSLSKVDIFSSTSFKLACDMALKYFSEFLVTTWIMEILLVNLLINNKDKEQHKYTKYPPPIFL